jgi:hypothetical protein
MTCAAFANGRIGRWTKSACGTSKDNDKGRHAEFFRAHGESRMVIRTMQQRNNASNQQHIT